MYGFNLYTLLHFIFEWGKKIEKIDIGKYNEIMMKIGDYIVFNEADIDFLRTLPTEKLIHIIKIYNKDYTDTICELLDDTK